MSERNTRRGSLYITTVYCTRARKILCVFIQVARAKVKTIYYHGAYVRIQY